MSLVKFSHALTTAVVKTMMIIKLKNGIIQRHHFQVINQVISTKITKNQIFLTNLESTSPID